MMKANIIMIPVGVFLSRPHVSLLSFSVWIFLQRLGPLETETHLDESA
jgi:hypothetical protein